MPRNRILGYRSRSRVERVIYILSIGLMLFICASFQVSFFGRIRIFGAVPDLMLCCVLCVSYFCGKYRGTVFGIAAGFLIETMGSQGISLLPVVYMLCGYIAGHYSRAILPKRYSFYLLLLGCGLVVRAATTIVYACITYQYIHLPQILLYSVLPEVGGTAIVGCVIYFPMMMFCKWLEK